MKVSKSITAKKVRKVAGLAKTKKFAGKTYTKSECSSTTQLAKKKAISMRLAGKAARVVKNPLGGACIYSRTKSK